MELSIPTATNDSTTATPLPWGKLNTPASDGIVYESWGNVGCCALGWLLDNWGGLSARVAGSTGCTITTPHQLCVNGHSYGTNVMYADGHVKWASTGYYMAQFNLETSSTCGNGNTHRTAGVCPTMFHE